MPELLVTLSKGYCVVGHPGPLVVQSLVQTVKRYGFNVVVDDCGSVAVSRGVDRLMRLKPKVAAQLNAVTAIRKANQSQFREYWIKMMSLDDKIIGTEIHNKADEVVDKPKVEVYAGVRTLRLGGGAFPTNTHYNTAPLNTSRLFTG